MPLPKIETGGQSSKFSTRDFLVLFNHQQSIIKLDQIFFYVAKKKNLAKDSFSLFSNTYFKWDTAARRKEHT